MYEIINNPTILETSYIDGPEYFNIYIKQNDVTICHRQLDAKIYPPKIRYTVDVRPHLKNLLMNLTDIFSSEKFNFTNILDLTYKSVIFINTTKKNIWRLTKILII
jgi:hypothetical protein